LIKPFENLFSHLLRIKSFPPFSWKKNQFSIDQSDISFPYPITAQYIK